MTVFALLWDLVGELARSQDAAAVPGAVTRVCARCAGWAAESTAAGVVSSRTKVRTQSRNPTSQPCQCQCGTANMLRQHRRQAATPGCPPPALAKRWVFSLVLPRRQLTQLRVQRVSGMGSPPRIAPPAPETAPLTGLSQNLAIRLSTTTAHGNGNTHTHHNTQHATHKKAAQFLRTQLTKTKCSYPHPPTPTIKGNDVSKTSAIRTR